MKSGAAVASHLGSTRHDPRTPILALDVGGANLKAAWTSGELVRTASRPFALWRDPAGLGAALAELAARLPEFGRAALTMTGELCDCFATKAEGVRHIVAATVGLAGGRPVRVGTVDSRFVSGAEAAESPQLVAAANWVPLAHLAAGCLPGGRGFLADLGSTTLDLIPLDSHGPLASTGRSDPARLASGELIYTGIRRTPACALLPPGRYAAELFATTLDAYLILGLADPDDGDRDTADGRPATLDGAHARLSRMLGGDPDLTPRLDTLELAGRVHSAQLGLVRAGFKAQFARHGVGPVVVSGPGAFLLRRVLGRWPAADLIDLAERLKPAAPDCLPALAASILLEKLEPC